MTPRIIKVGELFQPGVTHYEEMPEYNFRSGSHRLLIPLRHPRSAEIKAVRFERAEFAFAVIGPVIVFQYRFGNRPGDGLPWGDALYTWHKVPAVEQVPPAVPTGGQRVALEVFLLEANTGIVKAIRLISFTPEFSRLLHEAIREQAAAPYPPDYDRQAQRVLDSHTTDQLLAQARARCIGGSNS